MRYVTTGNLLPFPQCVVRAYLTRWPLPLSSFDTLRVLPHCILLLYVLCVTTAVSLFLFTLSLCGVRVGAPSYVQVSLSHVYVVPSHVYVFLSNMCVFSLTDVLCVTTAVSLFLFTLSLCGVRVGAPSYVYVSLSHVCVVPSHMYVFLSNSCYLPSHSCYL